MQVPQFFHGSSTEKIRIKLGKKENNIKKMIKKIIDSKISDSSDFFKSQDRIKLVKN